MENTGTGATRRIELHELRASEQALVFVRLIRRRHSSTFYGWKVVRSPEDPRAPKTACVQPGHCGSRGCGPVEREPAVSLPEPDVPSVELRGVGNPPVWVSFGSLPLLVAVPASLAEPEGDDPVPLPMPVAVPVPALVPAPVPLPGPVAVPPWALATAGSRNAPTNNPNKVRFMIVSFPPRRTRDGAGKFKSRTRIERRLQPCFDQVAQAMR
jgi:hypothetical protein